ncbi:MAG: cell wall-binding repeat-containing protein, partial [Bradymonadaceae bacterium]
AGYCTKGRYRPSHTCLMRESAQVMCPVCRHARDQYIIGLESARDQEVERRRRREEQEARQAEEEERRRQQEELDRLERERVARCEHVQRIDGANMYATAANISQALFPDGASTVILATDQEFSTDAMAAGPLASALGAPFMPVGRRSLSTYTKAEIERLGATKVIIVGGWRAVTPLVTRELKKMGVEVERVSGMTRFKTAQAIAKELHEVQGSTSKSAFIVAADERSIRDAITAGSLAAALNAPVLFVKRDKIPRSTARALRDLGIEHTYVVGSPARISEGVFADLPGPERVESFHAYDTATALAVHAMENELTDRARFFIAHGERHSDSVAASTAGNIILLTETDELNTHARGFLEKHTREIVILGDESVISANTRHQLCELMPN